MDSNTQPTADAEATKTPPPAEQVGTDIIAVVPISDGREITIHKFQAREFVQAARSAARDGMSDGMPIMLYLVGSIISCDGNALTWDQFEEIPYSDSIKLINEIPSSEIKNIVRSGRIVTGTLASGKSVEIKKPSTGDFLKVARRYADDKEYALVNHCVKIDGVQIDIHDVRIMDGLDYMQVAQEINSDPT